MTNSRALLLMTQDAEVTQAVALALGAQHGSQEALVCKSPAELRQRLQQQGGSVVLVDIDPDPDRLLAELEGVINRFPDRRFVVLCSELRNEWLLLAMQSGARHYLVKNLIASQLESVLQKVSPELLVTGEVLTVLSASGGCGATTLAINLGNELRLGGAERVLVVDADPDYGGAAGYLGLQGEYTLADVLADAGRLDPHLVRSTALVAADGLEVLPSAASLAPARQRPVAYEHLAKLARVCKHVYAVTVFDAPRLPLDLAATLAAESTATLLVLELNVEDLRVGRQMLSFLTQHGISPHSVLPVINRYRKVNGAIPLKEARKLFNGREPVTLVDDFKSAIASINYGKPLARASPRSALRKSIRSLASRIRQGSPERALVPQG
ncbi:MAG: AAA family ATPase [Planctomycetota bacterium]